MVDPKYTGLPGIAYDQPDVYETFDLPEADQSLIYNTHSDADSVENLNITAQEAYEKFKDKKLDSAGVDFSDHLSSQVKRGYNSKSTEVELTANSQQESLLEKYQRLRSEIDGFLHALAQEKIDSHKQDETPSELYQQVEQLRNRLMEVQLQSVLNADFSGFLTSKEKLQQSQLISHLEALKSDDQSESLKTHEESGKIVYELRYKPECAKLEQTETLVALEQRLSKLEKIIGEPDNSLIDLIEGRLQLLGSHIQHIAENKQSIEDADKQTKLMEMYSMLNSCAEMCASLPLIADRLVTLQNLHEQDLTQQKLQLSLQDDQVLLNNIQQSIQENMEVMNKNLEELTAKISALKAQS